MSGQREIRVANRQYFVKSVLDRGGQFAAERLILSFLPDSGGYVACLGARELTITGADLAITRRDAPVLRNADNVAVAIRYATRFWAQGSLLLETVAQHEAAEAQRTESRRAVAFHSTANAAGWN